MLGGDVGKFGGKPNLEGKLKIEQKQYLETLPNSTFKSSHTSKIISPLQVALTLIDLME